MTNKIRFLNKKGKVHIEVKTKNKKGTYIYNENVPLDSYVEYLKRRGTKKEIPLKELKQEFTREKGTKSKTSERTRRAVRRYKKTKGTLEKTIKGGIVSTILYNADKANREEIHKAKKRLMSRLVLDKDLLDLIVSEENFKKIQHRLDYEIALKDNKGQILIEANKHGLTPEEIIKRLRSIDLIGEITGDSPQKATQRLNYKGITNHRTLIEGKKIAKIDLKITFRKR